MNWFIHETAVVSSFTQHIIFMLKVAVVLITAIEHYALVLSVHIPCDYWDKKRTGGGGDICHRANQCPPTPLTSWPLTLPDMKTLFTRSPPIFPIFLELYILFAFNETPAILRFSSSSFPNKLTHGLSPTRLFSDHFPHISISIFQFRPLSKNS